ncbi:Putative cytoplasmic protein [Kosakonia radicincitans]|nr:Putative cytoplasmic protein [Kosakonia radicincitans]
MGWDRSAAVDYLVKHAGTKSRSECAKYTLLAASTLYKRGMRKIMATHC